MSVHINLFPIIYAAILVFVLIIYMPKLRQFFSAKHRIAHKKATEKRRISVVIPARTESEVIGDLFNSIAAQDYDRDFYDVNVIVDNENDPTVEMAKDFGANVFVIKGQKCKGDALDGYFKQVDKQVFSNYAAFVIVDADAYLTSDYLTELNNALEYDAQIFLSRKFIKNFLGDRRDRSLYCNCSAMTYAQLDDLCNIYRSEKGIPLNMCGQGMMVRREVIEEIGGWPYRTLTEDYEMRMDCFLKGFTSLYYPYAIIYTEEVLNHKDSYMRRLRWVTGFSQCDRKYKKSIRRQARERGKMTEGEFEYFFSLVPPVIFIVATIICVLCGVGISIWYGVSGAGDWLYAFLMLCVLPLGVMYLVMLVYAVMCVSAMRDAFAPIGTGEKIRTAFFAPFFMIEYFPIFIHSRFKSRFGWDWKPTRHIRYRGGIGTARSSRNDKKTDEKDGEGKDGDAACAAN